MPALTRRTLLKASAAAAGGFGLGAAGNLVGTAFAVAELFDRERLPDEWVEVE